MTDGPDETDALNLLDDLLAAAKRAGADAADAILVEGTALSHAWRLGRTEHLERAESRELGLRIFVGARQAVASSSDQSPEALDALVERALAMARSVPEDPHCGLAPEEALATAVPDLDIFDPAEPAPEELIERARRAEEAALAVAGVTNSEGAEASWSRSRVALAATSGFRGTYRVSSHGVSVAVIAGEGGAMERDYDWSAAVYGADLAAPEEVGRSAGEKAVRRLNPTKAETAEVPVIYDPRVAASLLRHLAGAVNGAAVARGTTFLREKLGEAVFASGVRIVDDPHRPRGLASRPFDAEGCRNDAVTLVEDGRLVSWLLDARSARQLGLATNGRAARSISSPPSPASTNLHLEAGEVSPEELLADVRSGLYVTELIGFGVNGVTGDYSRGASGFWIENGEIARPVSEVTIAGNLLEMYARLTPANDLVFRYAVNAPTVRIDGMTVAGR